jgi:hypothetical protein
MTLGVVGAGHVLACDRVKVAKLPKGLRPTHYFEGLEHNQKISSCCRHPENHDISAFKSKATEEYPDIYKFHCTCGRTHVRFMCGAGDVRPLWEAR